MEALKVQWLALSAMMNTASGDEEESVLARLQAIEDEVGEETVNEWLDEA